LNVSLAEGSLLTKLKVDSGFLYIDNLLTISSSFQPLSCKLFLNKLSCCCSCLVSRISLLLSAFSFSNYCIRSLYLEPKSLKVSPYDPSSLKDVRS